MTAARDAQVGWLPLQDEMAALSTNSLHQVLANVTHSSLIEDEHDAGYATQAIRHVVEATLSRKGIPEREADPRWHAMRTASA